MKAISENDAFTRLHALCVSMKHAVDKVRAGTAPPGSHFVPRHEGILKGASRVESAIGILFHLMDDQLVLTEVGEAYAAAKDPWAITYWGRGLGGFPKRLVANNEAEMAYLASRTRDELLEEGWPAKPEDVLPAKESA